MRVITVIRRSVSTSKCILLIVSLFLAFLHIVIQIRQPNNFPDRTEESIGTIGTLVDKDESSHVLLEHISPPGVIVKAHEGLGNQLFNYASSLEVAKKFNIPLYIYSYENGSSQFKTDRSASLTNPSKRKFMLDFFHFPVGQWIAQNSWKPEETKFFTCEQLLYNKIPQDYIQTKLLINSDYCHCEIFLQNVSKEIKANLFPVLHEESHAFIYWKDTLYKLNSQQEKTSVAIHIRRGDFASLQNWITPISYYKKAMRLMKQKFPGKKINFFVFSDDADYVKENLLKTEPGFEEDLSNEEIHFVSGSSHGVTTDLEQFILISMCKNKIVSNSTFSWWATYLSSANEDTVVIAPTYHPNFLDHLKNPHQREFKKYVMKFKYPSDWIRIDLYNGTGLGL